MKIIQLKYRFLFLGFLFALDLAAQKPAFVSTVARPGDGVLSMLRQYKLDKPKCNLDRFYEINEMSDKDILKVNAVYKLPLYAYIYNGESIRSTLKIDNWDKAVRIKAYNEAMVKAEMRHKGYSETKILWVPHHELGCKKIETETTSTAPTKPTPPITTIQPGKDVYPIFGKELAKTPRKDNKLANRVFYIVGGHGGPDPGAVTKVGKTTVCEDEYAYDVSLRLARNLIEHGATVYVIIRDPNDGIRSGKLLECDNDEQCWKNQTIPLNNRERLEQRSSAINKLYEYHKKQGVRNQQAIMIHVDSRSVKERIDLFFYHFPDSKSGKKLATTLYDNFVKQYKIHRPSGEYDGTVTSRDLHMLRETKPSAVYVELGNIRNKNDQKRIFLENNRQALAKWLTEGLLKANAK